MIGQGDFFQAQVTYTQGAARYVHMNDNINYFTQDGGAAPLAPYLMLSLAALSSRGLPPISN